MSEETPTTDPSSPVSTAVLMTTNFNYWGNPRDIILPVITLVAGVKQEIVKGKEVTLEGWHLPGGGFTTDEGKAYALALKLEAMIRPLSMLEQREYRQKQSKKA